MNVVVATIPGDGSTNEEFHFTAHLFEGIAKQGANDNCGGPATQLEAGRAWIEMIKDGTLPKPKRTVRFLWVPEISGTTAYLMLILLTESVWRFSRSRRLRLFAAVLIVDALFLAWVAYAHVRTAG